DLLAAAIVAGQEQRPVLLRAERHHGARRRAARQVLHAERHGAHHARLVFRLGREVAALARGQAGEQQAAGNAAEDSAAEERAARDRSGGGQAGVHGRWMVATARSSSSSTASRVCSWVTICTST